MSVLLMQFSAPMQSWGSHSRFTERDTEREPTKSGVIGLLCAALGRPRTEKLDDLAALRMGVRVDKEGIVRKDFQTAGGGQWNGQDYGVAKASGAKGDTVISNRYYLTDAVFLVGLEGGHALLERLQDALLHPVWPLFLGRKAFVAAKPIWLKDGLRPESTLEAALSSYPCLADQTQRIRPHAPPKAVRFVLECRLNEEGEIRQDVPISFQLGARRFGVRRIRESLRPWTEVFKESAPCI